ncbi:MAG TPA: amidohydrolase family protein [Gemmatimonadales bacterium]
MPARRLSARWVFPMDVPPVERGAVLIDAGRFVAVGPEAAVPRPAGARVEEFAGGLLLPGLVNTHTHLELTGFGTAAPETDFAAWIRGVRTRKAERSAEAFLGAARAGLAACWAAGVTTIADTGDSGAVIRALAEAGGSGVVYQEVFGPDPAQAAESLAGLQQRVAELCRFAGGRVRLGVSPHAPYTVSGELYGAVARWAGQESLPLAVHVAESAAESALLADGTGAFAEAWSRRGIAPPVPLGHTPVEWLERHGVLGPTTLCIHVIRAGPRDIARLAAAGCAVAHCPRSNAAHGHGSAPLGALLEAGLRVGAGTDSVLSVGEPDLLAEARMARRAAALDAEAALRLCTLDAARALDLEGDVGSITPGKWADCIVVRPGAGKGGPPAEQALATGPDDVLLTILGGRDVYRAGASA